MSTLHSKRTWDLVDISVGAAVVGCRWVFTLKYFSDGSIERYKTQLVAKRYTQHNFHQACFINGATGESLKKLFGL